MWSFGKIQAQAYDTAAYKCAADDLLLGHGVDILFHALGAGVVMDADDTIRALIVETKSGRAAVIGRIFIDCSGDGDLAAWAGAPFERGDGAGGMLYPTMMFRLNGVDPAAAGEAWKTIPALMDDGRAARREISAQGRDRAPAEKSDRVARQRHADEAAGRQRARRHQRRRAVRGRDRRPPPGHAFFEFLKREAPGFGNAYIVDTPPQLGIRETRRITGHYQLSRRRRAHLRKLSRHHRRQRLADRDARRRRRRMAVAANPGSRAASTTCPTGCCCRRR